jgi:hypothetical protein
MAFLVRGRRARSLRKRHDPNAIGVSANGRLGNTTLGRTDNAGVVVEAERRAQSPHRKRRTKCAGTTGINKSKKSTYCARRLFWKGNRNGTKSDEFWSGWIGPPPGCCPGAGVAAAGWRGGFRAGLSGDGRSETGATQKRWAQSADCQIKNSAALAPGRSQGRHARSSAPYRLGYNSEAPRKSHRRCI